MAKIFIIDSKENGNKDLYERVLPLGGHEMLRTTEVNDLLKPLFIFKPDVIVMDIQRGDSTNIAHLRELKAHPNFSNTLVLVIVDDCENDINLAMSAGASEYLLKPIRETELISRINILLNRKNLLNDELAPGTIFHSKYKILSVLGKGGDSTVYQAVNITSNNEDKVALKILKLKKNAENFTRQFEREIHELKRLDHPNIVKLVDHGRVEGIFYVATEFIKGRSLGDIIKDSPLTEETAVDLALQVAEVLEYMNNFGIIHRDIKPDNILISNIGEVKIVDFGLAREEHQQTVSIRGEISGTPQYLAPEYIDGKQLTSKTDIYSLGITLFYMTSGILPFQGRTAMALLNKQLNEPPPILCETTNDISKEFSDLIGKMMIKKPEERISLEEMTAELHKLAAREDVK